MFQTQTISCGSTAKQLILPGNGASGGGTFKITQGNATSPLPVLIQNSDPTNSLLIGGIDVATAGGISLSPGESLPLTCLGVEATTLYGYNASSTVAAVVMVGLQ